MYLKPFALSLIVVCLAACGGGGDDEDEEDEGPDDASAAGYFTGTLTPSGGALQVGNVLVTEDGRFAFVGNNTLYAIGTGTTNVNSFTASGSGARLPPGATFPNGSPTATISFTGIVAERGSITGTFSGGGLTGSFNYTAYQAAVYERAASPAILAGVYQLITGTSGTQLLTSTDAVMSITAAGAVTFNDVTGCVGTGTITAPFPSRNYYNLTLTLSGCSAAARNATYTGLGLMTADPTGNYRVFNVGGSAATVPAVFFGLQGAR